MLAPADTSPVNSRPKFLRGFAPLGFGRLMVPRCKAKDFRRAKIYLAGWFDDVVLVVSILKFEPLCVVPFTG